MPAIPRIARVPLTAKQPEACPHCGSRAVTRRGTRKKKLEIVQLWRCSSCKRVFTPGPAALHNRTYPLRVILSALTDYDTGQTLAETAARLKKKTHRNVSASTIGAWLDEYEQHCSYRRLRARGLALAQHCQMRMGIDDLVMKSRIEFEKPHERVPAPAQAKLVASAKRK